jgi:2-polyprenyl-3-methyl-5-hydroxy-6-metoxy-1,4-benzoquinol methylase
LKVEFKRSFIKDLEGVESQDLKNFSDAETQIAWNAGAAAWDQFVESGADYYRVDVHAPALLAACEPLHNRRVLELGCGQGFFCRALARRGARVSGVDIADGQIALARSYEEQERLGIEFFSMPAQAVASFWPPDSFDLVTGCMSLQDMADVRATLEAAFSVLRAPGRLVFSIPHPGTDTPFRQWEQDEAGNNVAFKIDRYFESGATVCNWNMSRLSYHWVTPSWRYTLSEWSSLIAEAGFLIRRLEEPRPTAEQVQDNPHLDDCYRLPYFLIFDLVKQGVQ